LALSDAYATAEQYRAAISDTDDADDDGIREDLVAVSRYLDHQLNQPDGFGKDDAPVARIYVPFRDGRVLYVDNIATTTGLAIKVDTSATGSFSGLTALPATDYQLWPLNAALRPEPRPYDQIVLPSWSTRTGWVTTQPVQVTARFGWPSVPRGIRIACIQLVGILRIDTPRATGEGNMAIDEAMSISKRAQDIIQGLMSPYSGGPVFA
jgi:hypothetical protein